MRRQLFIVFVVAMVPVNLFLQAGCGSSDKQDEGKNLSGKSASDATVATTFGGAGMQPRYYREPTGPWGTGNDQEGNRTDWDNPNAPAVNTRPPAEVVSGGGRSNSSSTPPPSNTNWGGNTDWNGGSNSSSSSSSSSSNANRNTPATNNSSTSSNSSNSNRPPANASNSAPANNSASSNSASSNSNAGTSSNSGTSSNTPTPPAGGVPAWFKTRQPGDESGLYGFGKGADESAATEKGATDLQPMVKDLVTKYIDSLELDAAAFPNWGTEKIEAVDVTVDDLMRRDVATEKSEAAGGTTYVRVTLTLDQIVTATANTLETYLGFADAPSNSDVTDGIKSRIAAAQK
ncbi:MAG: hypothetical protein AB7K09_17055 [Planctomycetota bacterium]